MAITVEQPEQLLAELSSLRAETRNKRHAYWLPAGVFGLLLCAAAPLYVQPDVTCSGQPCSYIITAGVESRWLAGLGGGIAGIYWAFTIVVGALITLGWYTWYGRVTGLSTRVRVPVLAWTVGLLIAVGGVFVVVGDFYLFGFLVPLRSFLPMFVIGAGLIGLAVMERSRLLGVAAVFVSGWAVLVSLYNVENLLYQALSWLGVSDQQMPFTVAQTIYVLIPGLTLLATAGAAFWSDLTRR